MNNHFKHPSSPIPLKHLRGFTLIEIMITMVIIGILASMSWVAYDRYTTKNRRVEGVRALMEASSLMEKCYVNNNTYAGCTIPDTSERGHYSLAPIDPQPDANVFTLAATAQNAQAGDDDCTTLVINHLGERSHTGNATDARRCWGE